jgi:hypothetical protein
MTRFAIPAHLILTGIENDNPIALKAREWMREHGQDDAKIWDEVWVAKHRELYRRWLFEIADIVQATAFRFEFLDFEVDPPPPTLRNTQCRIMSSNHPRWEEMYRDHIFEPAWIGE